MGEISRDSPACGIFQIVGNNDDINPVHNVLSEIVNEDISTVSSIINSYSTLLTEKCPLLVQFLLSGEINISNKINLLKDLLKSVDAPFVDRVVPDLNHYGPIGESHHKLEFFPNKPLLRGRANYKADSPNETEILSTGYCIQRERNLCDPFFGNRFLLHSTR